MAMTLTDIFGAVNALNQVVSNLATILNSSSGVLITTLNGLTTAINQLPHSTATSSAAPATPGTIVFSSSLATGFMIMQTSSGTSVKVPTYSNP